MSFKIKRHNKLYFGSLIYLLTKIMEKDHLHVNKIKLHDFIKKRIFKNKKKIKKIIL